MLDMEIQYTKLYESGTLNPKIAILYRSFQTHV